MDTPTPTPPTYTLTQFQQDLVARTKAPWGLPSNDAVVLALTALGEARGEGLEGQIAVMQTVLNRVAEHGRSITERALQRLQYSCWWSVGGSADNRYVLDLARRAMLGTLMPPAYSESVYLAGGVISGRFQNYSKGATHYCTYALLKHAPPPWAIGKEPVTILGTQAFFRGIPWA